MATNINPRADGTGTLGRIAARWANLFSKAVSFAYRADTPAAQANHSQIYADASGDLKKMDGLGNVSDIEGVAGPASSSIGNLPTFSTTDGQTIQDSGTALVNLATTASLTAHTSRTDNPHNVTYTQAGADQAGTAAAAIVTHKADVDNPHFAAGYMNQAAADLLYDAIGSSAAVQANLDIHTADTANPHSTTASQVGATDTSHTHDATGSNGPRLVQAVTHQSPDTDTATTALHHTLGTGANQAAAGNHTAHTALSSVNYLQFVTSSPVIGAQSVGKIYWDETNKTAAVDLLAGGGSDDVTLQLGQEQYVRCINKSGANIVNGAVVYIDGAHSKRPQIYLAKADAIATCNVIGVATHDIADNDEGYVTTIGTVDGLNTAGYTAGDAVYLSAATAGEFTKTAPTSPNLVVHLGHVTYSNASNGRLLVDVKEPLSTDTAMVVGDGNASPTVAAVATFAAARGLATASGLTTSATDKVLGRYSSGAGAIEEIACTAAGRAILDDATAGDQRTTLGLGTIATQAANNVAITGGSITGITDLAIADGGTGASTATSARDNLGAKPLNGFENRTDSTLGMSGSNFQITTASSYNFWTGGTKYTKSTTQQVTISNDKTLHFAYYDTAGVLQVATSAWDLLSDNVPAAVVFKDGSTYVVTDERHGYRRNRDWHKWAHSSIGARYVSGFTGTFTNTTLSVTQGTVADEDIAFDSGGTKTDCNLWYRDTGGAAMRVESGISTPYKANAGVIQFDSGGTLTNADNNKYVCYYVYASPVSAYPIQVVVGQAQHTTITSARSDTAPTIVLSTAEWKLLYRVIYQNVGGTATYTEAADYRTVSTGPAVAPVANDHQSLINRDAVGAHPLVAIDINGGTADTDPDDADKMPIYSGDATANRTITLAVAKAYMESAPNILVNSNGLAAINQRAIGASDAIANLAYHFDRWYAYHDCTTVNVTQESGGGLRTTVASKGTGTFVNSLQKVENWAWIGDTGLTLSANIKSNSSAAKLVCYHGGTTTSSAHTGGGGWETLTVAINYSSANSYCIVGVVIDGGLADGKYFEIDWIKLEEGSVATPWTVPDPAQELARCQRYYQRFAAQGSPNDYPQYGVAAAYDTTHAVLPVPLPVAMRTAPTLSNSTVGNFALRGNAASDIAASGIAANGSGYAGTASGITVASLEITATGLTAFAVYQVFGNNDANGYIAFDAEL